MDTRRISMDMGNAKASSSAQKTLQQVQYPEPEPERRKTLIAVKPRILVAGTGCLDAKEFTSLCGNLTDWGHVACVTTKTSLKFIDRASLPSNLKLFKDETEWSYKNSTGGVLHDEIVKRFHIMIIAPLSANSLAKIGGGISDNLLTCIVRGWDFNKPLLVAPSMHKSMWTNPFTVQYLKVLQNMRVYIFDPVIEDEEAKMPNINVISDCVRNFIHFGNAP